MSDLPVITEPTRATPAAMAVRQNIAPAELDSTALIRQLAEPGQSLVLTGEVDTVDRSA